MESLKECERERVVKSFLDLHPNDQMEMIESLKKEKSNVVANAIEVVDGGTLDGASGPRHPITNVNTNKHEKARYIEMLADPSLVALWTDAYSPFEGRVTLDEK